MRGRTDDLETEREYPFSLDADVQIGRLAGNRKVSFNPLLYEDIGRAALNILRLFVRDADQLDSNLILLACVIDRTNHRCQRPLHVVSAAANQPVSFNPWHKLLSEGGDDIEMAMEND